MILPISTCKVSHLLFYFKFTINSLQLKPKKHQDISLPHSFPSCIFPPLESQLLNAITCAKLALIFLRSLDHMGGRFSLSQGCNVTG